MDKVFCSECKYFNCRRGIEGKTSELWNPECLHPENKRKVDDDDWYEKGEGWETIDFVSVINKNNDCKWYKSKYE